MDTSKPYVGYRSPRRAERNNDRVASSNAPLAAIRGWVAGTAGLPGDLEGLVRMLPGINRKEPVLPTSEFYKEWLPLRGNSPTERAFTEAGSLFGGAGATNVARALKTGASAGSRGALSAIRTAAENAAVPRTLHPQAGVIKMKGGNWLDGSVEDAVKPLQVRVRTEGINGHTAEQSAADQAINQWLDKKLARYVKNEMATPEDPVRTLIERGVSHVPRDDLIEASRWVPDELVAARRKAGFPELGVVENKVGSYGDMTPNQMAASGWESLADDIISSEPAGVRNSSSALMRERLGMEPHPWLGKIDPNTPVYDFNSADSMLSNELGFPHLVDELRNTINPQSGLPRELLWKYSDLDKVTVPQAVQRVSDINAWRAAQKAEADLLKANNAATVLNKEYPEAGYKWVELKLGDLPEGHSIVKSGDYYDVMGPKGVPVMSGLDTPEDAKRNFPGIYDKLADALKYEGDTMGHCVGGYCDEVAEGKSRIFSLRDKKGQPHVTIEVAPQGVVFSDVAKYLGAEEADKLLDQGVTLSEMIQRIPNFERPQKIVQIKGKQNRAPNPEYLPYVQDFVRSGKWSDVGDFQNAGFVKRSNLMESEQGLMPELGDYLTVEEIKAMRSGNTPGYAAGGLITYDQSEIDDRVLQLMSELESEGA